MRGFWYAATLTAAAAEAEPALDKVSVVSGAVGSALGDAVNSVNPLPVVNIGGLLQTALGDGNSTAILPFLRNTLGSPSSTGTVSGIGSASLFGPAPVVMNTLAPSPNAVSHQIGVAQSVFGDPTSVMNQSSLANLLPSLTGGRLNNTAASNLLGLATQLNGGQPVVSSVVRDPSIAAATSALTGNGAIGQSASTVSNIGSTIQSGIGMGNAIRQQAAVAAASAPTADLSSAEVRSLQVADLLTSLTGALTGTGSTTGTTGTTTGGLDLATLTNNLIGGASGLGSLLNLNTLANTLTGGTTTGSNGINLTSLVPTVTSALASSPTAIQSLSNLASQNLQALNSATNTNSAVSNSSSTLTGVASAFITNNYLNSDGQIALKSSSFAQKALQYPDLIAVLNGQAPISSADGQLTPAVQNSLKQLGINATTPAALISTITGTDTTGQTTNQIASVSPLSSLLNTNTGTNANALAPTNATAVLEQSQKALQDSIAALTNQSGVNDLLSSLNLGTASKTSRVLSAHVESSTEAQNSEDQPNHQDMEGLKKALVHFNEALKRAIKANEADMNKSASADSVGTAAINATPSEPDAQHRLLNNWFTDAWSSIKNAFNGSKETNDLNEDAVNWREDIDAAAEELADNLDKMSRKIRETNIPDMMDSWFQHARQELEAKASAVLPSVGIGSASFSPSSSMSGLNTSGAGMSRPSYIRRVLTNVDKSGAFSAGYDSYNFQQLADPQIDTQLTQLLPLGQNNMLANLGSLGQPMISTLTQPLMGAMNTLGGIAGVGQTGQNQGLFPGNLLNTLLGGQNQNRLFQENSSTNATATPTSTTNDNENVPSVLGQKAERQRQFQKQLALQQLAIIQQQPQSFNNGLSSNNGLASGISAGSLQPSAATVLNVSPLDPQTGQQQVNVQQTSLSNNQQLSPDQQQMAMLLQQQQQLQQLQQGVNQTSFSNTNQTSFSNTNSTSNSHHNGHSRPHKGHKGHDSDDDDDDNDSHDGSADGDQKDLQSIDVKDWINKLSSTELGKTFGLDRIDVSKLPTLPSIEDKDLENFMKDHDWEGFFNSIRLSDLPGLQGQSDSELKKLVTDGKFGEILSRMDLRQISGLENLDIEDIIEKFHKSQKRRLTNDAASIISTGSNNLSNSLLSGSTNALQASQQSLLNQLQGIASLTNGLTGLSSGLGYGLTGLNTGALTGTNLLSSGIGNLLSNINSGLGSNLNNLGSGLQGLTSSIGNNLSSGLSDTGTSLGSSALTLPDLSSLSSLIPTNTASTISSLTNSVVQPALSNNAYGFQGVAGTTNSGTNTATTTNSGSSSATTSDTSSSSSPNALAMLHALVGMRRLQGLDPSALIQSLKTQLGGLANLSNGMTNLSQGLGLGLAGLGNGLSQGSNLVGAGANTLLGNLNANLGSQLGQIGSELSHSIPGFTSVDSTNSKNTTSASTGVAIPDLQNILGGNHKSVQSVGDSNPTQVYSLGANLPNLASLTNTNITSLPDLSALTSSLSSAASIPNLSSVLSGSSLPGSVNVTNPLGSTIASLPALPDISSLMSQLSTANNITTPTLPDLSSLLTAQQSSITNLIPDLSAILTPNAAAAAQVAPAATTSNMGSNVASVLNGIQSSHARLLIEQDMRSKAIEQEEVNAKAKLSAEFRQEVDKLKRAAAEPATPEEAQLIAAKIAVFEADYNARMEKIGDFADAERKKLTYLGQAKGGNPPAQAMGNAAARALAALRVIDLEPNAITTTTTLPPAEWGNFFLPPMLRAAVDNMIVVPETTAPPYITAKPRNGLQKRQLVETVYESAELSIPNMMVPGASPINSPMSFRPPPLGGFLPPNNLPAFGGSLPGPSGYASWNGGPQIANSFRSSSVSVGGVPGFVGLDSGHVLSSAGGSFRGPGFLSGPGALGGPGSLGGSGGFGGPGSFAGPDSFGNSGPMGSSNLYQPAAGSGGSVMMNDSSMMNSHEFASASGLMSSAFDPVAILTSVTNSNLDISKLFQILAKSSVDWNSVVQELNSGVTFESLLPQLVAQGLDVGAIVQLISQSNLNTAEILNPTSSSSSNASSVTLDDLLSHLKGVDMNALVKSAATNGVDIKSLLLMFSKDGVNLQSVADSPIGPIIGHVSAVGQLEGAFEPQMDGLLDPHRLQETIMQVSNQIAPL